MGTSDELTILEKLQPICLEWVEASLFKIPSKIDWSPPNSPAVFPGFEIEVFSESHPDPSVGARCCLIDSLFLLPFKVDLNKKAVPKQKLGYGNPIQNNNIH